MTLNRSGFKTAVASLLPCYWLYQEIGQNMAEKGSPVSYLHYVTKCRLADVQDLKDVEISVRGHFFEELKITATEIAETPVAPTAYNYVNHMHMTLNRSGVKPAVAALLPCYWLYQEIGQKMAEKGSPVSYYQEWIDTYDGEWYGANVAKMLHLTNSLAESATNEELEQMQTAFVRSSYYELQFWQMAYEKQDWK